MSRVRIWNIVASLIAVVVLISAGRNLKALLLPVQDHMAVPAARQQTPEANQQTTATETAPTHPLPAATPGSHAEHSGQATEEKGGAKTESKEAEEHAEAGHARHEIFLWINFLLIVGAFWYLCKKYLGPFLQTRAQSIREDMQRSSKALEDANNRLSAIENSLTRLNDEIGELRNSALREAAAERVRIEELAKADAGKIAHTAEQEIAAATKAARQELKTYAAELAIGLAEKKLQESVSVESEKGIFRAFVDNLRDGGQNGGSGTPQKGGA